MTDEVIEKPLSTEALGSRFRELCDDPRFRNLPGKLELDPWGRILMSPANNRHSQIQGRLVARLIALGDGESFVEASVVTPAGLFVADVVWASNTFMQTHGAQTPYERAPELCIEVASPSNSRKELREKIDAYLLTGALEAWVVYPQSKRIEFFGAGGQLSQSQFVVDLQGLFE